MASQSAAVVLLGVLISLLYHHLVFRSQIIGIHIVISYYFFLFLHFMMSHVADAARDTLSCLSWIPHQSECDIYNIGQLDESKCNNQERNHVVRESKEVWVLSCALADSDGQHKGVDCSQASCYSFWQVVKLLQ